MSRTYYEWRDAHNAWLENQNQRISSLPYPGRDSVVYERESNNPFWERRREYAESLISLSLLKYDSNRAPDTFRQIAAIERQKEEEILHRFLPNEEIRDTDSYIDKINLLMQNRDRYNKTLDRLAAALDQERTKGAPNMSSYFATYLEPILIQKMEKFQEEFIQLDNPKERYIQLIQEAMKEASTKMAQASTYEYDVSKQKYTKNKSLAGGLSDWREINRALKDIPGMWELFTTNVMKAIGNWDTLYSNLINNVNERAQGHVRDILKLQNRTFSIGGNVAENAMAAVAIRLNQIRGSNGSISYSIDGGALTVEGPATADSFLIFSADSTISATDVFQQLNSATDKDYYQKLGETVNQFKENLNGLFGIFINAKNYSIGTEQKAEYTVERGGQFDELPAFFSEMQMNLPNIYDFLDTVYNSGIGAIAGGTQATIEQTTIDALRVAMAKIMFDDYAMIGSNEGNIIHLYQLSGKFIPSSVMFDCLANSIEDAFKVRARVTLPPPINDPGPKGWSGATDADVKKEIYNHWNEEFQRAHDASTWYVQFTLNIKNALKI